MLGCGCLFAMLAAMTPRAALILVWLFTDYVQRAFQGFLIPMLGIVFLPYTTLFYVISYNPVQGLDPWGYFFVAFGFVLDLGSYSSSAYANREKISTMESMTPTEAITHVTTSTTTSKKSSSSKA